MSAVNYTYGDSSWGDLLTGWNGKTITSDTIGNMLSDGTWNYTWEHGRELASMSNGSTTWSFTYNADGLRTKRTNGSTTYSYVYSGSSLSQMTVGGNTLYFAYDASGTPLSVTYNGTNYYYATNIQGDVTAILNTSGTAVVQYTYDAWGKLLTTTGSMASDLGVHNPLRYRGYVYENETQLYYLQSRYYNPILGRFLNADAFGSTGQGLLSNNMFAYCQNNPVKYTDPSGCTSDYPGEPGYEWAWDLGWWIKEKIEEYKKKKEERKKSVKYIPNEHSDGAKIENAHNITNPFYMYKFITENRGDEIEGSNSGVISEWIFHNIAYDFAELTGNQKMMDQAGTVDIGNTIWSDNHGVKTVVMIGLYAVTSPFSFIYDSVVAIK